MAMQLTSVHANSFYLNKRRKGLSENVSRSNLSGPQIYLMDSIDESPQADEAVKAGLSEIELRAVGSVITDTLDSCLHEISHVFEKDLSKAKSHFAVDKDKFFLLENIDAGASLDERRSRVSEVFEHLSFTREHVATITKKLPSGYVGKGALVVLGGWSYWCLTQRPVGHNLELAEEVNDKLLNSDFFFYRGSEIVHKALYGEEEVLDTSDETPYIPLFIKDVDDARKILKEYYIERVQKEVIEEALSESSSVSVSDAAGAKKRGRPRKDPEKAMAQLQIVKQESNNLNFSLAGESDRRFVFDFLLQPEQDQALNVPFFNVGEVALCAPREYAVHTNIHSPEIYHFVSSCFTVLSEFNRLYLGSKISREDLESEVAKVEEIGRGLFWPFINFFSRNQDADEYCWVESGLSKAVERIDNRFNYLFGYETTQESKGDGVRSTYVVDPRDSRFVGRALDICRGALTAQSTNELVLILPSDALLDIDEVPGYNFESYNLAEVAQAGTAEVLYRWRRS
jgi:hypothetical protein